jgi:DNA-binding IclR family transcriptional regulator
MLPAMQSILTEPAASTLLVLDAMDGATLTEIARTTGRPLSTIQRAVNGLVDANVVVREMPRGRLRFTPEAPRHALRELAEWRLGKKDADRIARAAERSQQTQLRRAGGRGKGGAAFGRAATRTR